MILQNQTITNREAVIEYLESVQSNLDLLNLTVTPYFGSFYDTTTQSNAGLTAVNVISLDTTVIDLGCYIDTTKIYLTERGWWNLQFSIQYYKSDGGDDVVDVWLRKNGEDLDWSNTSINLHSNNAYGLAAWNFFVESDGTDFFSLCWASKDGTMQIQSKESGTNPTRPAVPSVILTCNRIKGS
jgi:hypothetical protein